MPAWCQPTPRWATRRRRRLCGGVCQRGGRWCRRKRARMRQALEYLRPRSFLTSCCGRVRWRALTHAMSFCACDGILCASQRAGSARTHARYLCPGHVCSRVTHLRTRVCAFVPGTGPGGSGQGILARDGIAWFQANCLHLWAHGCGETSAACPSLD